MCSRRLQSDSLSVWQAQQTDPGLEVALACHHDHVHAGFAIEGLRRISAEELQSAPHRLAVPWPPVRRFPGRETAAIRGPRAARRGDRRRPTPHTRCSPQRCTPLRIKTSPWGSCVRRHFCQTQGPSGNRQRLRTCTSRTPPGRKASIIRAMAVRTVAMSGAKAKEFPTQTTASHDPAAGIGSSKPRTAQCNPGGSPKPARARSIIAGLRSDPSTSRPQPWNMAAWCPVPQATSTTRLTPACWNQWR